MFRLILGLFLLAGPLKAQDIHDRIMGIKTKEDFVQFVHDHRQRMFQITVEIRTAKTLPKGVTADENSFLIEYKDIPEYLDIRAAVSFVCGGLSVDASHQKELLNRGFPESDLPVLAELSKQRGENSWPQLIRQFFDQKTIGTPLEPFSSQLFRDNFFKTPQGKRFLENREQVKLFLKLRAEAGDRAEDQMAIDRLAPLKIQSIRVLLSYAFEHFTKNAFTHLSFESLSEWYVDYFIETAKE